MQDLLLICGPLAVVVYAAVNLTQFELFLNWVARLFQ
jgi:hypothetical protein